MGQGRARVYNLLTLIITLATVAFAVAVILLMLKPPPEKVQAQVVVPTMQQLPTLTSTHTPTNTSLPTFTSSPTAVPPTIPATQTPTFTPVPIIPTLAPTLTPIPTETPITPTSTGTLTPTVPPSPTIVPSATITTTIEVTPGAPLITQQATVPPPSPFPFTLKDGQVIFIPNTLNAAGCAWQGLGGQVFDINNQPFTQVRVHVFGSGVDAFAQAGSNTLYGPSGWEIAVGNFPSGNIYQVELQTLTGTIVSQPVTVAFSANDCSLNLALVNFAATR